MLILGTGPRVCTVTEPHTSLRWHVFLSAVACQKGRLRGPQQELSILEDREQLLFTSRDLRAPTFGDFASYQREAQNKLLK